ncbi:unnamed protein product, partial [Amoebophrya sp. A120]|eukprot:GSA120T00006907001.1
MRYLGVLCASHSSRASSAKTAAHSASGRSEGAVDPAAAHVDHDIQLCTKLAPAIRKSVNKLFEVYGTHYATYQELGKFDQSEEETEEFQVSAREAVHVGITRASH